MLLSPRSLGGVASFLSRVGGAAVPFFWTSFEIKVNWNRIRIRVRIRIRIRIRLNDIILNCIALHCIIVHKIEKIIKLNYIKWNQIKLNFALWAVLFSPPRLGGASFSLSLVGVLLSPVVRCCLPPPPFVWRCSSLSKVNWFKRNQLRKKARWSKVVVVAPSLKRVVLLLSLLLLFGPSFGWLFLLLGGDGCLSKTKRKAGNRTLTKYISKEKIIKEKRWTTIKTM